MNTWTTAEEQKPEANGGRLDDIYRHAPALDDLEDAAAALVVKETDIVWMPTDLHRLRETVAKLDAVGARVERKLT